MLRLFDYDKDCFAQARELRLAFSNKEKISRIPFDFLTENAPVRWNMDEKCEDSEKAVEQFLFEEEHFLNSFPEGSHIPVFDLAYLGEGVIPSMFGAVQMLDKFNPPFTEGRLMQDLETDLPKLKRQIDPENDGWGPRVREAVERFVDVTGGVFQVSNVDIQSTYGVATKLIDNETLMLAMYDTPELVHELFEICTDAIINTTNHVIKWAGGRQNVALNVREPYGNFGISMYDDYVSVINPALSESFCLKYNRRVFEAFGDGHYHTCGPYFPNYLPVVLENKPRIMDVISMRAPLQKTREDMLELKRFCDADGIALYGDLTAYPVGQYSFDSHVLPDRDFVLDMCGGGRTIWKAAGSVEQGKKWLSMCDI